MKFFLVFTQKSVPEWVSCYYDYSTMKNLIVLCRKAEVIRANINDYTSQKLLENDYEHSAFFQEEQKLEQLKEEKYQIIFKIVDEANRKFYYYHIMNKELVFTFCQMKIHELKERIDTYESWQNEVSETTNAYAVLLSNCYVELKNLSMMAEINLEAYRKIQKKHTKSFSKFDLDTPSNHLGRINRSIDEIHNYQIRLQGIYEGKKDLYPRKARNLLSEQVEVNPIKSSLKSYLFGVSNGFSLATLITSIILISIHLSNSETFSKQFQLWRGIGFAILYMWVFGLAFYIYEHMKLNYHLIFQYEDLKAKSDSRLGISSFLTLGYIILFCLYILQRSGIMSYLNSNTVIFFPVGIWATILLVFILEFIVSGLKESFFFKMLLSVVISIFPTVTVEFRTIWITQQLISLTQPVNDWIYTICFYSNRKRVDENQPNSNPCLYILITAQIYSIVISCIRLIQTLKIAHQNGMFFGTNQMFIGIRSMLNITVAAISLNLDRNRPGLIISWICLAIISMCYNYFVDIFYDWSLMTSEIKNGFLVLSLKQNRIFSRPATIAMLAFNVIFRFTGIFTNCSNVLYTYIPRFAQILITIAATLELFRRIIWNCFRVQKQHIENCEYFRIRTDYDEKEELVKEELRQNEFPLRSKSPISIERNREQIANVKQLIREKKTHHQQLERWIKIQQNNLQILEKEMESSVKKLMPR